MPFGEPTLPRHCPDHHFGHERRRRAGGGLCVESRRRRLRRNRSCESTRPLTPEHYSVDVRGLPIHWVEWGKRGPQPVILIHGFRDHCPDLGLLRRRVACEAAECLGGAPDCRGHGDSGWVGARRLLPFLRLSAGSRSCGPLPGRPRGPAGGPLHGRYHRLPVRGNPSRAGLEAGPGGRHGAVPDVVRRRTPPRGAVAGASAGGRGKPGLRDSGEAAERLRRAYPG